MKRTVIIVMVAVAALLLITGLTMSREKAELYDKLHEAKRICSTAIDDAALGAERRTARDVCDRLIANINAKIKETP